MPVRMQCPNPDCGASISLDDAEESGGGRCRTCGVGFDPTSPHTPRSRPFDPRDDATTEIAPGSTFGERYTILRSLGRGGMGVVYLARDAHLAREVAIKIPQAVSGYGMELSRRLLREAQAAAGFDHPNICPVFDVGQVDGTAYLTMAFIAGEPLSALIKRGTIAQERAVEIVRTLALALDEAHQHGVIHRDLKPANIMMHPRRGPVIMDFGLARPLFDDDPRLTQSGVMMGTPAYMPPEQVRGDLKAIGPATDIYALGVILYNLLAGRPPFRGAVAEILAAILHIEPEPVSAHRDGLDPRLDAVCRRAMAKAPRDRFASMAEMADALDTPAPRWEPSPEATASPRGRDDVAAPRGLDPDAPPRLSEEPPTARVPGRRRGVFVVTLSALPLLGLAAYLMRDDGGSGAKRPDPIPVAALQIPRVALDPHPVEPTAPAAAPATPKAVEVAAPVVTTSEPPEPPPVVVAVPRPTPKPAEPDQKDWAELGEGQFRRRDYAGAIDSYTRGLALKPDDPGLLRNRGLAHARQGRQAEALNDLDAALRVEPNDATALAGRAWMRWWRSYREGLLLEASADAARALQLDPKNALALAVLGGIAAEKNKHDFLAFMRCNDAILGNEKQEVLYLIRCRVYSAKGDHARALADADTAIGLDPSSAVAHVIRGLAHEAKGDRDHALADYDRALQLDPKNAFAYQTRGNARVVVERLDDALHDYDLAIKFDPTCASPYRSRGAVYSSNFQFDRALVDYNHAIRLDPDFALAYRERGGIHLAKDWDDLAIEDYNKAIEVAPGEGNGYIQRGDCYFLSGNHARAIADYTRAIEVDRSRAPLALAKRSLVYDQLGDAAKANKDRRSAIELHALRGEAFKASEDKRKAEELLETMRKSRSAARAPTATAR